MIAQKFKFKTYTSTGILEAIMSAFIWYSPNFLILFPFFRERIYLLLVYDYIAFLLLTVTILHLNYRNN
jgi:hypothetical protein